VKNRQKERKPASVLGGEQAQRAKQAGETQDRWSWVEPSVWTERMLAALANGVKGGKWLDGPMHSLPSRGCTPSLQPMQRPVNPLCGEPSSGEPCAGEPHARFGGGSPRVYNRGFLPLLVLPSTEVDSYESLSRDGTAIAHRFNGGCSLGSKPLWGLKEQSHLLRGWI